MIEHLRTLPPSLPALPPEEEAELEALAHLSDDTRWTIAREQIGAEDQERLQALMDKNSLGTLSEGEDSELEQLVDRGQRLMLRKSAEARVAHMREAAATGVYAPLFEMLAAPFRATVISPLP